MAGWVPWVVLGLAGLLEVVWALFMKTSSGFSRLWPSVWTLVAMAGSVLGLAWALKYLPVGTAYAVWTGIGAAGTAVAGMILFAEPRNALRLACLVLILAGMVGLKVTGD